MQLNQIVEWIDGAFGTNGPAMAPEDAQAIAQLFAGQGFQRYLQDQVNRQIIRDYLANAVLLGVIAEGGLAAFAVQLASEEGRSALALHMLMASVDEAMDLLPVSGQVQALTPLKPRQEKRPNIKLVPN